MNARRLDFVAPGASTRERARGLAAAELFLQRAGVSAEEAIAGDRAREAWGDSGLAPLNAPTPEELVAAEALDGALESALVACHRGGHTPLDAFLRMLPG
jgi:hypothetical protein